MEIEWRNVVGFEMLFSVSNTGEMHSKRTGRILKQSTSKKGYRTISTRVGGRNGVCHCFKIHRLVAEAFLPPPSPQLVEACKLQGYGQVIVRHLDDDKTNNRPLNLAWGTSQDNSDDFAGKPAFHAMLGKRAGCNNVFAKATPQMVDNIRTRYQKGSRTNGARAMAAEMGIHHTNIARLAAVRSYK